MSREICFDQEKGPSLMRVVTKLAIVALCVALLVPLAGCKRHKKGTGDAANADPSVVGSITVYTSLSQDRSDAYLSVFKQSYPNVTVKVVRDTPEAIATRIGKEKKAPVADVVWHTPLSALTAAEETGALKTYVYPPGQYDAVQGSYADGDHGSTPQFVGTDAKLIGWLVNTGKTGGSMPGMFDDLADPKYRGDIVMPSVNTEAGYVMVAGILSAKGEDVGWPYLDSLDQNVAYYTSTDEAAPKAVVTGDAAIGIGWDSDVIGEAQNGSGAQAGWPGLPELSPYDLDVDALLKPTASKAAKTFLNWAISDDAMNAYAKDTPVTAVDEGTGLPTGYPSGDITDQFNTEMDFSYLADNHDQIVKEWMKRYGKKIKGQ
jgi:iron(III) transport system substrate-binding protein